MTEELGAISLGLRVHLGTLDRDIAKIKKTIGEVERDHTIPFTVGKVSFAAVQKEIDLISRKAIPIQLHAAANSGRVILRELNAQLRAAGPATVQIKANLSRTEITRIKREIEIAMRRTGQPIPVPITGVGRGGGGGAAPVVPAPAGSPTPSRVARSAPTPPTPASAPVATSPASPRRTAAPTPAAPTPAVAAPIPAQPRSSTRAARGSATPTPAGPITDTEEIPRPSSGSTAAYLRRKAEKRAGRTVSADTLRAEKSRPRRPETEEEIEYASRPTEVSYHGPQAEMEFQQEKRSRGVRGARRSGARERNEPILLPSDYESRDIQQTDDEAANAVRRAAEIGKPSRSSAAFYGSRRAGSPLNPFLDRLQFYKFDPVLGQAFAALQGGDEAAARQLLTGFSSKLAGVDPRQRKKFFRLFRNVENVPPELLEKDAALRSLFAGIHSKVDPDFANVPSASTLRFGGGAPSGVKPTGRRGRSAIDRAIEEMNAGTITREEFERRFPTLRRRAGGGPVKGGLMARIAAAKQQKMLEDSYLVGEKRPERYVSTSGKHDEVVGENGPEVVQFPEAGKVEPFVPVWRRNQIAAKDLTGRAPGGPVRGFGGRAFRSFAPGEKEAIGAGLLTRGDSASVQRVFVVNMPAGGGGAFTSQPGAYGTAAGPIRFRSDSEALKSEIGAQLADLLAKTEEVTPKVSERETNIGPTARFEARREARRGSEALTERIGAARAFTSEQQQLIPVRSLSVAVGQIFSTIFGGRGDALTRAKEANALAAKATSLISTARAEEDKLRVALTKRQQAETPEMRKKATAAAREQLGITRLARQDAEAATIAAEKASQKIIGQTGALRNLAAGTVGVVAGTLLFSAALGAAQAGIEGVSAVLGPIIERMTGFTGRSAEVTSKLADETRAHGGAAQSIVAEAAARAGLTKQTADFIGPLLEQRAATEAGNKTLQEGIDLLHTYEEARRRGGQQGVFGTTGGFLGTPIGGTPSTQELIKKELGQTNKPQPLPAPLDLLIQPRQVPTFRRGKLGPGGELITEPEFDLLDDRIAFFNDALDKGGSKLKFMADASDETAAAFASAADRAGATEIGDVARGANKVILVDQNGQAVLDPQKIRTALVQLNQGQAAPDPALLIKQLVERIIPAQKALFRAEGNLQRNATIPGQFALGELAAPTPGTGGVPFEAGLVGKGDTAAAKAAQAYKTQVGGAVTFVNDQIAKGREALLNLVPADLRAEFSGLLDDIAATGQQISSIQLGVQQQQVNLQVHEYDNSLRIARRTLGDIRDLQAGIGGSVKDTLGGIEGQNIALNRQLQLLGFELQQRQINFRLATAGFVAPGTTPEERAARIEEAKKEAEFAQKQLDIQKQLAANQFRGIQISTSREATDLLAQIRLLQEGRAVTINTAAASRALDILNKKQQMLLQLAGSYVEEGSKIVTTMLQAAAQVQQQTGKGFSYILGQTANAWGIFGSQAAAILRALTGSAPQQAGGGGTAPKLLASGIVGDTLGPTSVTVGEAGREKVAVIKNPHLVPMSALRGGWSASGGQTAPLFQMTVIVTGNTVSDKSDLDELADKIVQKAEDRMMRKTSLLLNFRR
jgi:hypothetical protein